MIWIRVCGHRISFPWKLVLGVWVLGDRNSHTQVKTGTGSCHQVAPAAAWGPAHLRGSDEIVGPPALAVHPCAFSVLAAFRQVARLMAGSRSSSHARVCV